MGPHCPSLRQRQCGRAESSIYRRDSALSGLGLRRRGEIDAVAEAISSEENDSERAFMMSNSFTPGEICLHGIMPKVTELEGRYSSPLFLRIGAA